MNVNKHHLGGRVNKMRCNIILFAIAILCFSSAFAASPAAPSPFSAIIKSSCAPSDSPAFQLIISKTEGKIIDCNSPFTEPHVNFNWYKSLDETLPENNEISLNINDSNLNINDSKTGYASICGANQSCAPAKIKIKLIRKGNIVSGKLYEPGFPAKPFTAKICPQQAMCG